MKYIVFISSFLLVFFVQIHPIFSQFKEYPQSKKLIEIPTFPHQNPIDVFYIGEKPDSLYYQLSILEVYLGANDTYASVIKALKSQAQYEGMDGIMIFKLGLAQKSYADSDGYSNMYSVKEGVAYGIKYQTNFDYLTQLPKVETVHIYNDSTMHFDDMFYRKFDLFGKVIDYNCSSDFNNFLNQYSLYQLVEEKENWVYSSNYNNLISERKLNIQGSDMKYSFYYDSLKRLNKIIIQTHEEEVNTYKIRYIQQINLSYNENGQLHQKDIYPNSTSNKSFYREIFRYDELGRIEEKLIFKYSQGERIPIAKCFYPEFYSEKDLKIMFPELR